MWSVVRYNEELTGVELNLVAETKSRAVMYAEWFLPVSDIESKLVNSADHLVPGDYFLAKLSPVVLDTIQGGDRPKVFPTPTPFGHFVLEGVS